MQKPRLVIADDHPIVLEGLRCVVQEEFEVVGAALNGLDLVDMTFRLRPDAALFDLGMPLLNGIDAARRIRLEAPSVRLILITQKTDREYIHVALHEGIAGFVSKQAMVNEIVPALREVLRGRYYVSPQASKGIPMTLLAARRNPADLFGGTLTKRQREVLQLIAEGKATKEIAGFLHISPKTVDFHKACIVNELGLRSNAELTRYAIDHGMIGD